MNKREIKEFLRKNFPNIRFLRSMITKKRIRKYREPLLSEADVIRGESDFREKERLLAECLEKYPEYAMYSQRMLESLFRRAPEYKDRTDQAQLRTDVLFCQYAYGFVAEEYLCFGLEHKTMEQRRAFVSDIDRLCYVYRMNDPFEVPVFNNKTRTYEQFAKYFKRDAIAIQKPEDLSKFLSYAEKHPVFVKKAAYESMGRSVELVDIRGCGKKPEELFRELIGKGLHLLEEKVEQSPTLAALHPGSVNTIRCITVQTKSGIQVPYCFMKVGRDGSFVDNGGAGGIFVGIDTATGRLNTTGIDELNVRYETHPNTGIAFCGYQIPEWDSMIAICKEMSATMKKVKYIGWDMAHTDHGWVVIEGNGMSQMIAPQMVFQRGIKAEIEALIADMELMC